MLEYLDALYQYAMVLTGNSRDAEDLVEVTYIYGQNTIKSPRNRRSLRIALLKVLRNIWLDRLGVRNEPMNAASMGERIATVVDNIARASDTGNERTPSCQQVHDALQQLPVACREIVLLREYEELSYQEMAAILNLSVDTVMSNLVNARSKLRTLLLASQ